MTPATLVDDLQAVLDDAPLNLARAALVIARLEYPSLQPEPWLAAIDALGAEAEQRLAPVAHAPLRTRIALLNALIFDDHGFSGNTAHYDDFRNSCLNVVLERRLGIPITLALVYMEAGRRAGLDIRGVAFPGHFLMRAIANVMADGATDLILDPFNRGSEVDEVACRALLAAHVGADAESAPLDPRLLKPCTGHQMLARILNNLKRTYVELQSFERARQVTNLLLRVDPSLLTELRDRGLLAYHLEDYSSALRDLQHYLERSKNIDAADRADAKQIWSHVKTLRRRVAALN